MITAYNKFFVLLYIFFLRFISGDYCHVFGAKMKLVFFNSLCLGFLRCWLAQKWRLKRASARKACTAGVRAHNRRRHGRAIMLRRRRWRARKTVRLMRQLPLYNVEATKYTKIKTQSILVVVNHTCIHPTIFDSMRWKADIVFDLLWFESVLRCTVFKDGCCFDENFSYSKWSKKHENLRKKKRFSSNMQQQCSSCLLPFFSFCVGVLYVLELSKLLIFVLFWVLTFWSHCGCNCCADSSKSFSFFW